MLAVVSEASGGKSVADKYELRENEVMQLRDNMFLSSFIFLGLSLSALYGFYRTWGQSHSHIETLFASTFYVSVIICITSALFWIWL